MSSSQRRQSEFNDSLPQTDESVELRTHLDTASIPALGLDVRTPVIRREVQAPLWLLQRQELKKIKFKSVLKESQVLSD